MAKFLGLNLSPGKAGLYALAGASEGLAEAFTAEDKLRKEETSKIYDTAVKNYKELQAKRDELAKSIKEEDDAVRSLQATALPNGHLLSQPEALAVYQASKRLGIPISELISGEKYEVKTTGKGNVYTTEGTTTKLVSDSETPEGDGALIATGRQKQISSDARRLLRAAGIPEEVTMPGTRTPSGVEIRPVDNLEVTFSNEYVIDGNGEVTQQVLAKRTYNKRTKKIEVTYYNKDGRGEEFKFDRDKNQRIASAADAFKPTQRYNDFGPLLRIGADGQVDYVRNESGAIVYGYQMKNGEIRAQKEGKISDEVVQDVVVGGKHYSDAMGRGDLTDINRIFKIGPVKDFYEALPQMDEAVVSNNLLFSRSEQRIALHRKYGNRMYGITGAFADIVVAGEKLVNGAVTIVNGLQELQGKSLEEKIRYLESGGNIDQLRALADNQESWLSKYAGTAQEIAMARVLDSAIATVTAYDLAKQTGDTRISNQDFDAYISTVTGNNAEQTINLIKRGLEDSLTIYSSRYTNLSNKRARIPRIEGLDQYQSTFDTALRTVEPPTIYEQRIQQMFKDLDPTQQITIKENDFSSEFVENEPTESGGTRDVLKITLGPEYGNRVLEITSPRYFNLSKEELAKVISIMLNINAGNVSMTERDEK